MKKRQELEEKILSDLYDSVENLRRLYTMTKKITENPCEEEEMTEILGGIIYYLEKNISEFDQIVSKMDQMIAENL